MEEQLRKLVEYAEPKPIYFICVSGNKSRVKTSFVPALEFPHSSSYEMALTSLETYYTFPNIDATSSLDIVTLNIISHMTCWLTDQNGK